MEENKNLLTSVQVQNIQKSANPFVQFLIESENTRILTAFKKGKIQPVQTRPSEPLKKVEEPVLITPENLSEVEEDVPNLWDLFDD